MTQTAPFRLLSAAAAALLPTAIAALVLAGAPPVRGEEAAALPALPVEGAAALPAAREVLERSIAASGGRTVLEAAKALHFTGSFSMPLQGLQGAVDAWQAHPGKSLVTVDVPGVGQIQSGSDGTVGWSKDPMQGARLLTGKELEQARATERLLQGLDLDELYATMDTVGGEDFEGRPAWKLHLVTKEGALEQDAWYDVESGRQLGLSMQVESPMGRLPVTIIMADYKEFDGLTLPTRIVNRMTAMGTAIEQVTTIDTVSINPEALPSFDPPAEVKALQARAATGAQ
jgi:hypothetical protein